MTLADLASIGSFVSGIAVVVSLVYLALQIRQNTKHSQALIQQGRAARIADTALRLAELRADDGLNGCFEGVAQSSAKDVARFLMAARAVFISAEDSLNGDLNRTATSRSADAWQAALASLHDGGKPD